MKKILICNNCKTALSSPVIIQSSNDPDAPKLRYDPYKAVISLGTAYMTHKPYLKYNNPECKPEFWMNIDDLNDQTDVTDDKEQLSGCCDLDGMDGPNIVCKNCKHYVGTKINDCWTPLLFITESDATEWIEQ